MSKTKKRKTCQKKKQEKKTFDTAMKFTASDLFMGSHCQSLYALCNDRAMAVM